MRDFVETSDEFIYEVKYQDTNEEPKTVYVIAKSFAEAELAFEDYYNDDIKPGEVHNLITSIAIRMDLFFFYAASVFHDGNTDV